MNLSSLANLSPFSKQQIFSPPSTATMPRWGTVSISLIPALSSRKVVQEGSCTLLAWTLKSVKSPKLLAESLLPPTKNPPPLVPIKPLSTRLIIAAKKVLGLYNTSPLQTKLTKLAHFLFVTAVILVLVVFATARFNVSADVALYAISLALAIIPESLIAVVTITMAKGVTHMARRNAIVRRLDAIEALGGVTDICSDKTGTLTMGKMVVRKVWNGCAIWNCEGGDLSLTELSMLNVSEKKGDINDLLRCAALCNGAVVAKKTDKWDATGEPTEVIAPRV